MRKGFVRVRAGRGSINTMGVWHVRLPSARTASPDPPPSRPGPPTDFEGQKLHAISPQRCARKKWPANSVPAHGRPRARLEGSPKYLGEPPRSGRIRGIMPSSQKSSVSCARYDRLRQYDSGPVSPADILKCKLVVLRGKIIPFCNSGPRGCSGRARK